MEETHFDSPKLKRASMDLLWYFQNEDGEAGGLRAAHYRVLSAMPAEAAAAEARGFIRGDSSTGQTRPSVNGLDIYPDERAGARQRSRRIYSAIRGIDNRSKAILEAYFAVYPNGDGYLGLDARHLRIAAMFREVAETSRRSGLTRLQAARLFVSERGADFVRDECVKLVNEAMYAFVSEMP